MFSWVCHPYSDGSELEVLAASLRVGFCDVMDEYERWQMNGLGMLEWANSKQMVWYDFVQPATVVNLKVNRPKY
jgi:hypothetical protein